MSSEQTTLLLQPLVLDGPVTIEFPEQEEQGPMPLETPTNHPVLMRDSTVFHTPPSRPPASLPPLHMHTACVQRDPAHLLHSALPGPSFGPPLPSPCQLREHLHPNPKYFREDNAACKPQTGQLSHSALLVAAEYQDPLTFKEVMDSDLADQWQTACQYEMDVLAKNGTWTLVDLPPGCKAIISKWVFKHKADGCFCVHLVAKGFMQIQGIDYDKTFSPVARFESLRLLLALATLNDWEIHQMDVKSAFLNGTLDKEIYMEQPQGFVNLDHLDNVCLLAKAIYGLKQALCAWNIQFHGVLLEIGFTCTYSDAGIYVYHCQDGEGILIIILYVDDIALLGNKIDEIKRIKSTLASHYKMTDLGEINSYLGVQITCNRSIKHLEIDQSHYILEIINHFGMADANSMHTPLPTGTEVHLIKHDREATASEIKYYQQIIGSLLCANWHVPRYFFRCLAPCTICSKPFAATYMFGQICLILSQRHS